MPQSSVRSVLTTPLFLLASSLLCSAGQPAPAKESVQTSASAFDAGSREFQLAGGAFFSLNNDGEKRPTINDADVSLRLGWMLNTPRSGGCCRGNFELLLEASGAAVFEGPGTGAAGVNLLLRYNFVQPAARLVPYFQLGVGGLYNDIYKDPTQRVIGQDFEFELQGGLGARFLLSPRCALFLEADFRHISNANLADRNLGLNSVGGLAGVSLFF